jgi:hypothetical protein
MNNNNSKVNEFVYLIYNLQSVIYLIVSMCLVFFLITSKGYEEAKEIILFVLGSNAGLIQNKREQK